MTSIQNAVREMLRDREHEFLQAMIGDAGRFQAPNDENAKYLVDVLYVHDPMRLLLWAGIYLHDTAEVQS